MGSKELKLFLKALGQKDLLVYVLYIEIKINIHKNIDKVHDGLFQYKALKRNNVNFGHNYKQTNKCWGSEQGWHVLGTYKWKIV